MGGTINVLSKPEKAKVTIWGGVWSKRVLTRGDHDGRNGCKKYVCVAKIQLRWH